LLDTNPAAEFSSDEEYNGRFLDSFLNAGKKLELGAPMDIELKVM